MFWPSNRLRLVVFLILLGTVLGVLGFALRRIKPSPSDDSRAKFDAILARIPPPGVPDPYGHAWALPIGAERVRFEEALADYEAAELPKQIRGEAFMGLALQLGACAKKGEQFSIRDVTSYLGKPDYEADDDHLLAWRGQASNGRKFSIYLWMSATNTLVSAGFNLDVWPPDSDSRLEPAPQ